MVLTIAAAPAVRVPRGTMAPLCAYRASWGAVAIALPVAIAVLNASDMRLVAASFVPLGAMALLLTAAHLVYRHHRPDERLQLMTGALALLILAAVLAAIISHCGLRLGRPWIDPWLSAADRALGIDTPALALALGLQRGVGPVLDIVYRATLPLVFVVALGLGLRGRGARLWELVFCFALCILVASGVSVAFPAIGSMVHHHVAGVSGLPPGAGNFHLAAVDYFRNSHHLDFDLARIDGVVTFPSFHIAMGLMIPHALRDRPAGLVAGWAWCALVALATVAIGGHYVVDLLAGALLWAGAAWLVRPLGSAQKARGPCPLP